MYWLRDRVLEEAGRVSIAEFLSPETVAYRDLRATLVHELDVERSWRLRLQGEPRALWDVTLEPADYRDIGSLADDWTRDQAEAEAWLSRLSDDELAAPRQVNGLEGYPLSTYLVHIVMHGVESFSAAAILLHHAGRSTGDVGFLDFKDVVDGPPSFP